MAKVMYVQCPRCDLNYIDARQDICDVCKAELGEPLNTLIEEDEELRELCPICKRNFISFEEDMCQECSMAKAASTDPTSEDDEAWREFLDEPEAQDDETEEIPLSELQDEEYNQTFDDEEEEIYAPADDFEDDFETLEDMEDYIDDEDEDDESLDEDDDF